MNRYELADGHAIITYSDPELSPELVNQWGWFCTNLVQEHIELPSETTYDPEEV